MAVAHYSHTNKAFGLTRDVTWTHDSGTDADRVLIIGLGVRASWGQTVTTLTYAGTTLIKIGDMADNSAGGQASLEVWALINPSSGSNTVHAVVTGDYYRATSFTASACDQNTGWRSTEASTGSGHDYTISISSLAADWMYSFWQGELSSGWSHNTAGIEVYDNGGFSAVQQDTSGDSGTEQGGHENNRSCHFGVSLWEPQSLAVDVSGNPAIISASAAIGVIDDGNIFLSNITRATITASAHIGGVLIKEPIRADMTLFG